MKKIIYSILFVSALFLTSCSDDDDNGGDCLTCDDGTACDNGDGTVTLEFTEDGEEFTETYTYEELGFENFEDIKAEGCGEDEVDEVVEVGEVGECVTCAEYTTQGVTVPAQEVCLLENGNAEVLGADTGVSYELYLTTISVSTTCE